MIEVLQQVSANGIVLFVPIFIWNMVFWKKLPPAFEDKTFDENIPKLVLIGETIFRTIVFLLPLLTVVDYNNAAGSIGATIYFAGVIIYFTTWLLLIYLPESKWSKSRIGFCGPGFTPILWLVGFSLLVNKFNVGLPYTAWFYVIPSVLFVFFHVIHCVIAFGNWNGNGDFQQRH